VAAVILVFVASTSAGSSLDAPLPRAASRQADPIQSPHIVVAFTSGKAMLAGIALVP